MPGSVLANPPIIETTIPTNEQFYDHWHPNHAQGGPASITAPYSRIGGLFVGVTTIPAGFTAPNYRGGIAAVVEVFGANNYANLHLAFHAPAGVVADYSDGWVVNPTPLNDVYHGNRLSSAGGGAALLAAQRLGPWIYVLIDFSRYDATGHPLDTRRRLIRCDNTNSFTVIHTWNATPPSSQFLMSTDPNIGQMFVSDDEHPFIWLHDSTSTAGFWDNPVLYTSSTDATDPFLDGQLTAYLQVSTVGVYSIAFVLPWSAGDYGPPELWGLQRIDTVNGPVFTGERSTWTKAAWTGQNQSPHRFPSANPYGYGFADASARFTVGPMPGWLPAPPGESDQVAFCVFRDARVRGVLHLVLAEPVVDESGDDDVISGVWTARSDDDGKTWTPPRQMQPAHYTRGRVPRIFSAVRVPEGNTLVTGIGRSSTQPWRGYWGPWQSLPELRLPPTTTRTDQYWWRDYQYWVRHEAPDAGLPMNVGSTAFRDLTRQMSQQASTAAQTLESDAMAVMAAASAGTISSDSSVGTNLPRGWPGYSPLGWSINAVRTWYVSARVDLTYVREKIDTALHQIVFDFSADGWLNDSRLHYVSNSGRQWEQSQATFMGWTPLAFTTNASYTVLPADPVDEVDLRISSLDPTTPVSGWYAHDSGTPIADITMPYVDQLYSCTVTLDPLGRATKIRLLITPMNFTISYLALFGTTDFPVQYFSGDVELLTDFGHSNTRSMSTDVFIEGFVTSSQWGGGPNGNGFFMGGRLVEVTARFQPPRYRDWLTTPLPTLPEGGMHAALVVADPVTSLAATPESSAIVFRRGDNKGAVAWL